MNEGSGRELYRSLKLLERLIRAELDVRARRKRPPHLRDGEGKKRCGTCSHFSSGQKAGMCKLYSFPVQATMLCDSWESRGKGESDGETE